MDTNITSYFTLMAKRDQRDAFSELRFGTFRNDGGMASTADMLLETLLPNFGCLVHGVIARMIE